MPSFENPLVLFALIVIPLLIYMRYVRRDRSISFPIALYRGPKFDNHSILLKLFIFMRSFLVWTSLVLLIITAAGPVRASQRVMYLQSGNVVIFVLDVSPSMAAADLTPTRLEAAKKIISSFLAQRRNESVGLVVFGAQSALVSPPTLDYASLEKRLNSLTPGQLGDGTALGEAIASASAHALVNHTQKKYLILLTDGESNLGSLSPQTASQLAQSAGINIFVVGIGSEGTVPIYYKDPSTGKQVSGTFKSNFNEGALRELAESNGGKFFRTKSTDDLNSIFSKISETSLSQTASRSLSYESSFVFPLLILVGGCLLLAKILDLLLGGLTL